MRFLLFVAWVVLAAASPSAAHSVVERSFPTASSALDAAPRQVELWFNEPVDAALSSATVVDPAGTRVSGRASVSSDGRKMTVPLRELGKGFYTVRWRVLSSIDGHTTGGVFAFTVGLGARPPAQFGGEESPDFRLVLARWMGFVATILLAGSAVFPALVLRPGLRLHESADVLRLEDTARRRLRRMGVGAAVAVLITAAIELALRAATLTEGSWREVVASGQLAQLTWGTKPGWSALIRGAMAVLIMLPSSARGEILRLAGLFWVVLLSIIFALLGGPALLAGSGHLALVVLVGTVYGLASVIAAIILPQIPDFSMPELTFVVPSAGALMLAGLTTNSHAWGSGIAASLADWMHLAAVAAWIGGLAGLLFILGGAGDTERTHLARAMIPRFSSVAAGSVGVLLVTGLYATWLHVPGMRAFVTTAYGRYLGAKLVLIVPLLLLGAVNRMVLRPRFETAAVPPYRRFMGIAGGESALGAAVLLAVAALTVTPPARVSLATAGTEAGALRFLAAAGDVRLALLVDPARHGPNLLEVTVMAAGSRALGDEARVLVRLTKLDEDLAPLPVTLVARGEGRFVTDGGVTIPSGWWEAGVILRRRGVPDVSAAFPLRLGEAPAAASDPAAVGLMEGAKTAMASVQSWREREEITDGAGGMVTAAVEIVRPDRMRIRSSSGAEAVFTGSLRFVREPAGPWRQETLSRPFAVEGTLQYLRGAEAATIGREAQCETERCRIILWEAPGRNAAFAAWIGFDSRRILRLMMVAPQHHMVAHLSDFNAPIRIEPPK